MTHLRPTDPLPAWLIFFSWGRPDRTPLNRCPELLFSFLITIIIIFFYIVICVSDFISFLCIHTHPRTHAWKQFQLNFSNKKETLLALGIYHGWNVLGDKVPLNLSLFNIQNIELDVSYRLQFFSRKTTGVIFPYWDYSSVFWSLFNGLKLSSKLSVTE